MCGIIAYKGKNSVKKVLCGLKKLEYRGYDSCGIALLQKGKIDIVKCVGYVDKLNEKIKKNTAYVSIGHTRWATHGKASILNSHPHTSESGNFALVHNGIIENYKELVTEYLQDVNFYSDTDSEVIPNMIEYYYNKCGSVLESIGKVCGVLKGSFAFVLVSKYDDHIYFARNESPLVVGVTKSNYMLASDINGLEDRTNVAVFPNKTYGVITDKIFVFDDENNNVELEFKDYSSIETNKKLKYSHYMLKEIYDIPKALIDTYDSLLNSTITLPCKIENILIVACGTSYHSGLMLKKYFEKYVGISTECEIASEFIYNSYIPKKNTLSIFISQSGETADTLKALEKAKKMKLFTLGITNNNNSSMMHLSDSCILMSAGSEISVASTKAYTTQILVGLMLVGVLRYIALQDFKNDLVCMEWNKCQEYMIFCHNDISMVSKISINKLSKDIDILTDVLIGMNELLFVGKDFDYVTAMESSLKVKEVTYIFTDSYPCGELKHGTLSLIDRDSYVFVFATSNDLLNKTINSIHEIKARGGHIVVVTSFDKSIFNDVEYVINIPKVNEVFLPMVSIIPIQLIAYKLSCKLGFDPDKPRNLAKSVTVE